MCKQGLVTGEQIVVKREEVCPRRGRIRRHRSLQAQKDVMGNLAPTVKVGDDVRKITHILSLVWSGSSLTSCPSNMIRKFT